MCTSHAAYTPVYTSVSICLYVYWDKHAFILQSLIRIQNHGSIMPALGLFVTDFCDGRNLAPAVHHLRASLFSCAVQVKRFQNCQPIPL